MRLLFIIFPFLILSGPGIAAQTATGPLPPFTLRYDIEINGFGVGELVTTLRNQADGLSVYEKTARMGGLASLFTAELRTEKSEFRWVDGKPQALLFEYLEQDGDEEERHKIVFHRDSNLADVWWRRHFKEMAVPADATDRATLDIDAVVDARGRPREMTYTVVDRGKLKERHFERLGTQTVETPAGEYETVKYRLFNPEGKNKEIVSWLATDLHFLPVRIDHHEPENGLRMTMRLREARL